jgi:hypothetical protein
MSLISLTFGSNYRPGSYRPSVHTAIVPPFAGETSKGGKFSVKKVCRFYNCEELYVIGEVTEGGITDSMKANVKGNFFEVVEVESKIGARAKKGMNAGILVKGLSEDAVSVGDEISFLL